MGFSWGIRSHRDGGHDAISSKSFSAEHGNDCPGDGQWSSRAESTVGLLALVWTAALKAGEGPTKHLSSSWLTLSARSMCCAVVVITPWEPNT